MACAAGPCRPPRQPHIKRAAKPSSTLWGTVLSECRPELAGAKVAALVAAAMAFVTFYPQTVVVRPDPAEVGAAMTRLLLGERA